MSEAGDPSALPAREQAAEQAHPLRKIFDHANDAILLIDPEHDRILDANAQASRMLG
jgi:PAS domain-containing protein